jgi:hypothetical protein
MLDTISNLLFGSVFICMLLSFCIILPIALALVVFCSFFVVCASIPFIIGWFFIAYMCKAINT